MSQLFPPSIKIPDLPVIIEDSSESSDGEPISKKRSRASTPGLKPSKKLALFYDECEACQKLLSTNKPVKVSPTSRFGTPGALIRVDHDLFCDCKVARYTSGVSDVQHTKECSHVWKWVWAYDKTQISQRVIDSMTHKASSQKTFYVLHSSTHHIEIPEKSKSHWICAWDQPRFGVTKLRSKIPEVQFLKSQQIRNSCHKIGEAAIYQAGEDLVQAYEHKYSKIGNERRKTPLYFLHGVPLDPKMMTGTDTKYLCLCSGMVLNNLVWEGLRVWDEYRSSWRLIGFHSSGQIFEEKKFSAMHGDYDGLAYWKRTVKPSMTSFPDSLFHQFDPTKNDVFAGETQQVDKLVIHQALQRGDRYVHAKQFVVTLFGALSSSMRIKPNNGVEVLKCNALKIVPIVDVGHAFSTTTLTRNITQNAVNTWRMLVANEFFGKQIVDPIPKLIELTHVDEFVRSILSLFWGTLLEDQRALIPRVKLSYVYSPNVLAIFRAKQQMLAQQNIGAEPVVTFHGIRSRQPYTINQIVMNGFVTDLVHGNFAYGQGVYGAFNASYTVKDYLAYDLGTSNLGNKIFITLMLPGRSLDGERAQNMPISRDHESFYGLTDLSKVLCARDNCVLPIALVEID